MDGFTIERAENAKDLYITKCTVYGKKVFKDVFTLSELITVIIGISNRMLTGGEVNILISKYDPITNGFTIGDF